MEGRRQPGRRVCSVARVLEGMSGAGLLKEHFDCHRAQDATGI